MIDLANSGQHATDLAKLWRSGAEVLASRAGASDVDKLGVRGLEQVVHETPGENQLRLTGPDPRLAAEIALASGFRAMHGPGVASALAGDRGATTLHDWQYVDRLIGWYEACGVPVERSYAAPLQGVICPPAAMCASLVLDGLLGAEAGVRHMVLELHENLHLQQDVATLRVLPRLAQSYLGRLGHGDISVAASLEIWSGRWPEPEPDMFGLLGFAVLTASLGGAAAVVIHPSARAEVEDMAKRVRFARSTLLVTGSQRYPDSEAIDELAASIERDARAMIDATLARDTGDLPAAVALAFERGIVEIPTEVTEDPLPPLRVRKAFDPEWARTS